jgi:hypothetical protein
MAQQMGLGFAHSARLGVGVFVTEGDAKRIPDT